jgi:3'(2'), 5'-bisphosphate nucleotidase
MADQETEALIVHRIRERFPSDCIVGEESGHHEGRPSARRWLIDPIDGTRDFAAGGSDWAVHIGLCEGDTVTMGVVFQPRAAQLTWGVLAGTPRAGIVDGHGEESRAQALRAAAPEMRSPRVVISHIGRSRGSEKIVTKLLGSTHQPLRAGSTGIKLSMLARNLADIYVYAEPKTRVWDTCAPMAALLAVGGVVTDLRGCPLAHDDPDAPHLRGILAGRTAGAHAWALKRVLRGASPSPWP